MPAARLDYFQQYTWSDDRLRSAGSRYSCGPNNELVAAVNRYEIRTAVSQLGKEHS